MFELDPSLKKVDAPPERVVSIITSLNNPSVMTDLPEPEPTLAFICSVQLDTGNFGMWIYLYHQSSHVARIYSWSEGEISRDQFPDVEAMALDFAESMGFVMDNAQYRKKPPEERIEFYNSLPIFSADLAGFAANEDAKDDPSLVNISEDMEEIDLDNIEGGEEIELVEAEEEAAVKSVLDEYEEANPPDPIDIEQVNPFDDMQAAEPEAMEVTELETLDGGDALEEIEIAEELDATITDPDVAKVVSEARSRGGSSLDDTIAGLDDLEGFGDPKPPAGGDPFGDDSGDLDDALNDQFESMVDPEEEIVDVLEEATPQDVIEEEVDFSEPEPEPEPVMESFDIELDTEVAAEPAAAPAGGDDLLSDEALSEVDGVGDAFGDEALTTDEATPDEPEVSFDLGGEEETTDVPEVSGIPSGEVEFEFGGEEESDLSLDVAESEPAPEPGPQPVEAASEEASDEDALYGADDGGDTTLDFGSADEEGESTASGWQSEPPPVPAAMMASLEEEIADEEPAPPAALPGLEPAEVAVRLEKIGRLLSIW